MKKIDMDANDKYRVIDDDGKDTGSVVYLQTYIDDFAEANDCSQEEAIEAVRQEIIDGRLIKEQCANRSSASSKNQLREDDGEEDKDKQEEDEDEQEEDVSFLFEPDEDEDEFLNFEFEEDEDEQEEDEDCCEDDECDCHSCDDQFPSDIPVTKIIDVNELESLLFEKLKKAHEASNN